MKSKLKTKQELKAEVEELRHQLFEANETIEAIRTGKVNALIVEDGKGPQLYTLTSADIAYRVFIENMTEGAVTLNRDGIILYCNSQFAAMINHSLSKVISMPFSNFISAESKRFYEDLFEQSWKHDSKGEVELIAANHNTPVQLSFATLKLDDGISLSMILTDLTALKKTQKQLKQNNEQLAQINNELELSNHDLQQFASVASHDLQEPLRKIQIFSNLLRENQLFTPESKMYLDKIIESSGRMRSLIIDILDYSSLSADDQNLQCIDLNELFKELKDDFELIIHEKGAEIITEQLPCIDVNKGQIRQVFQNIISNALKFSKPGKTPVITISSKKIKEKSFDSPKQNDGPFCLISIRDNGIGFNEKYVSNVFALFERLNSKDKYEGTGIGMAIAKKIIDKHNGLITAISKEGKGAEFKIILPVTLTH